MCVIIIVAGTTTNRTALISFKQGAFLPKLPVQPVLIKYKNKLVCYVQYYLALSAKYIFHSYTFSPTTHH